MDIDYHYYVIKTLACTAGFAEEDAQTIAYYSQQVDDFTNYIPMRVKGQPPAFFIDNGYAKQSMGVWQVKPHPTGIDVIQSLWDSYRRSTLSSFHFIPARSLEQIESQQGFSRAEYRCVRADDPQAELINCIIEEAVEAVQAQKCEKSLMQLGMALHTYADTYAHCGYSGLDGWENCAVIKKAYNQQTKKEEVPEYERLGYRELPHIGHGNSGHVPDICTYQIDVAMQKDEHDHKLGQHIDRDNLNDFLDCAKVILEYLGRAAQTDAYKNIEWDQFRERLAQAMQVPTVEETNKKKLTAHWNTVFPEIAYAYSKNERFYEKEANLLEEENMLEEGEVLLKDSPASIRIYDVTDAFYMYNELAYRRAETVLGSVNLLKQNAQMLKEEQPLLLMNNITTHTDRWEPKSELALAVQTAGFEYHPDEDIICSTMNNVQRLGGYCKGYDEAAVSISSIIDSEPIYFNYDGYEWMIELWKGQYGIGTGCEIGVYYREQGKPLSLAEKTLMGKLYDCVPDDRLLDMRFAMEKDNERLFERDWMKHWWLTGFRWGLMSEPEQLAMTVGIRFPNSKMQQAFVNQGLESLGYKYTQADDVSVEFCFAIPMTTQPAARASMRQSEQEINQWMVKTYNTVRTKCGITTNDPNVIEQMLLGRAGAEEKILYEALIKHFSRKSEHKDNMQKRGYL